MMAWNCVSPAATGKRHVIEGKVNGAMYHGIVGYNPQRVGYLWHPLYIRYVYMYINAILIHPPPNQG